MTHMKPTQCADCGASIEQRRGGIRLRCAGCSKVRKDAYGRQWHHDHREHRLAKAKKWYRAKRKKSAAWKAENKRRAKAWRERNRDHVHAYSLARAHKKPQPARSQEAAPATL